MTDSTGSASARLRELITQWREDPKPRDTAKNFPAGHDMTERRFVLHECADKLEAALGAVDVPTLAQPNEMSVHDSLHRMVAGCLRSAIEAHGPITKEHAGSAAKRIVKQWLAGDWDRRQREQFLEAANAAFAADRALNPAGADVPPPQPPEEKQ